MKSPASLAGRDTHSTDKQKSIKNGTHHPGRKTIQSFFDGIPTRYDFLNTFLSFGSDQYWRKRLVEYAARHFPRLRDSNGNVTLLDLGAGTGKSLEAFLNFSNLRRAVGCDFSFGMMNIAQKKLSDRCQFVGSDFHHLPFAAESFDVVTGSFILRSVEDFETFFGEVKRVLRPGGKFFFLELTRPQNQWFWIFLYKPYLKCYLPLIGRLISRNDAAYRFLSDSVETFIEPRKLAQQMSDARFISVEIASLMGGLATILEGEKVR